MKSYSQGYFAFQGHRALNPRDLIIVLSIVLCPFPFLGGCAQQAQFAPAPFPPWKVKVAQGTTIRGALEGELRRLEDCLADSQEKFTVSPDYGGLSLSLTKKIPEGNGSEQILNMTVLLTLQKIPDIATEITVLPMIWSAAYLYVQKHDVYVIDPNLDQWLYNLRRKVGHCLPHSDYGGSSHEL